MTLTKIDLRPFDQVSVCLGDLFIMNRMLNFKLYCTVTSQACVCP